MAKIIKIGSQNLTPAKIANPFKTSRNSTTNPFKYQNFEGKTLEFEFCSADVFKKNTPGRMKMIASSVAGSMNKMRASIAEPIINFVNYVTSGISGAWNYAKNTNISEVVKLGRNISADNNAVGNMNKLSEIMNEDILTIGKGISSKMEFLNKDISDIAKDLSGKWTALIAKYSKPALSYKSVSELEQLWLDENAKTALEGAA